MKKNDTDTTTGPAGQMAVTLVGGPPDWAGKTLTLHADANLEVGAALISSYPPPRDEWEDPAPRAIYDPDPDEPTVWRFRGWFPASPTDPDPGSYGATEP